MKLTDVIRRPLITEKTTVIREDGRTLCFQVATDANKIDIKRAVEALLSVRVAGGSQGRAVWEVVLPVLKMSLLGSWLLIFVIGTRELSTAMFLSGPQTRVVSV